SVRERGDMNPRGRNSRVPDPGLDREWLVAATRAVAEARAAAAGELIAAGLLDGAHVSPAARDLLLEHLGDLFARYQDLPGPVTVTDTDLELTVFVTPVAGAATVLRADDGAVTIDNLMVRISAAGQAMPDLADSD